MPVSRLNRRHFLRLTAAGCGLSLLPGMTRADAAAQRPPNIVFIMADDLGWKELGCYGQEKIKTPCIDRMAAEGMRFTQYYAGSAVCAPSRCVLMTGKHGGHAYVRNNQAMGKGEEFAGQLPIPADEVTVAELLKSRGYATGCFGKWGLGAPGSSGDPLTQGFDRFYGYNCQSHAHNLYPRFLVNQGEREPLEGNTRGVTGAQYAPQRIADAMLQFVRDHKDEPFFLYYPTVIPHLALQVPEEELAPYKGLWEETPYTGESYQPHPTPRACYAAMISFMDKQVGRLFALLKELGLDNNTIVFFTSDNGTTHLVEQVDYEFFDSVGPLRGLKGSLYEGGIRVPMVAWWPGRIAPATVSEHVAAHYDVLATFAGLVGAEPPASTDGISFLPTLLGDARAQRRHEYLFWDFTGYGGQLAVRMGKWKGIKTDLVKNPEAPLELYNLEEDLSESTNVAGKYPDIAGRIGRIMLEGRSLPEFEAFRFGEYLEAGG
ncbi:MAG TPA: arylsulfatase [Candidatus Hydrogenedentes bacterium]|nr:arylsulfatase [Candidatus Hydrogenedentota bacterium]HPX39024.1 arylsulfatase [Candidatus Hydrogenedentota bacterium]